MNFLIISEESKDTKQRSKNFFGSKSKLDTSTVLNYLVKNCSPESEDAFIFSLPLEEEKLFLLNNNSKNFTPNCKTIRTPENNGGTACAALLATPWVECDKELLIIVEKAIPDIHLQEVIRYFKREEAEAGVISIQSGYMDHPHVRLDKNGSVLDAAVKNSADNNAILEIYWFKKGKDFVTAAENMVRKDAHINNSFSIAPVLNELILSNKKVQAFTTDRLANNSHSTCRTYVETNESQVFQEIVK